MFLFKKKKIVVDCFTCVPEVYNLFPIKKAIKYTPEWWKRLPSEDTDVDGTTMRTMKKCAGFIDLYKSGFIMEMWSEMSMDISETENGPIWKSLYPSYAFDVPVEHHPLQSGYTFSDKLHMKLTSPWLFSEKTGVNFAFIEPSWNIPDFWHYTKIVPAVVNYKYQHGTHVNMFFSRGDYKFIFAPGMPLVHFVPLTDKDVEVKNHLVSYDEFNKIRNKSLRLFFKGHYENYLKLLKKKENNKKKCPFGFGK